MPQTRYITSEAQIGAPGVYVREQAPAAPTRGQRRRVAGFAGQCVRGPVGVSVLCNSYQRFLDVFGARDRNSNGGTIIGNVWKALQGKSWGRFWVSRAAAAAAVAASYEVNTATAHGGTNVLLITAANVGAWGNDVAWRVFNATNGDANYFNLAIKMYGKVYLFQNITIQTGLDNTNQVIGNDYATLITLTKLASGRPVNSTASTDGADANGYIFLGAVNSGYISTAGSDGSIADADYTGSGKAIDIINNTRGIHACAVVGRSNTAIKTKIGTLTINQRVWYVCPDDQTISISAAVTERATFSTDKMSYWFNHVKFIDSITQETILEEPFVGVMSVITQTDPDVHPGDFDNAPLWQYAVGVQLELADPDRDTLDAGGVSFMFHDIGAKGNDVIVAGNALTCDFAVNNQDLDGRYMKDFLLDAIANRLRGDQFKGNTKQNRASRASSISGFLAGLARQGRYIQSDEDTGKPQFSYKNNASVNSVSDQATGLQREKLVATLIPKNKYIELLAVIGVDASVIEL